MRRGQAALLGIAALLGAADAAAAEPVGLDYHVETGIDGCPDADGLHGSVAARLGYDPFREDAKRRVSARVRRAPPALRADIDLRASDGQSLGVRSLKGERCGDLAEAMALAIAMAVDPTRAFAQGAPVVESPASAPSDAPPPRAGRSAPLERDAPASSYSPAPVREAPVAAPATTPFVPRVHAVAGVAGFGPVAGVTPLLAVGGGLRYGAAALDLEGRFLPPSSEGVPGGTVRTSMLGLGLLPCAYFDPLFLCGIVTIGALQGEAVGVDAPEKASTLFAQAGGRLGGTLRIHARATLEPFADLLATLTRTRVNFRGQEVWSTSPLGVQGGVRVAVHFP